MREFGMAVYDRPQRISGRVPFSALNKVLSNYAENQDKLPAHDPNEVELVVGPRYTEDQLYGWYIELDAPEELEA